MSKKYGNPCATYNIPLNNDDDDVFRTGCVHLYNFLHGKSAEYKPFMLKMHLEFVDSPSMTEPEGKNIEEQLETEIKALKDALQQPKNDGNQLMDRIDKLEKNNSLDHEKINTLLSSSNNAARQSVQQLEARIKTLEDALLQTKSDGNKLTEGVETIAKSTAVDKSPDGGNNITQDSNANKETNNENNLSDEQHYDTENVTSTCKEHHACPVSEEKQEVLDLRPNCVLIQNPKCNTTNLDEAFSYVRKLANEMNARIADNSIIHIDMADYPEWYVYFRDADSKFKFLRNRFIYEYNPNAGCLLRILDYSDCGIVDIENFQSSDLSLETAFVNVLGLAKKMGIKSNRNFIDHIDVHSTEPNFVTYSVRFNSEDMKNTYLQKRKFLKKFSETQSLKFSDGGGHTLSSGDVNNFSMALASANIIGFAELMGLSLPTDDLKRIYVLNVKNFNACTRDVDFSLVVEFSSNDLKNKFLKKTSELNEIGNTWISNINISDIEMEGGNFVSIKYDEDSNYIFTAISFIGLAKQLGFSFTPDQTDCFIQLSEFISNASS